MNTEFEKVLKVRKVALDNRQGIDNDMLATKTNISYINILLPSIDVNQGIQAYYT